MSNFLPNINFQFFSGKVEDVDDPLKLGRVRVRAHGYHSESTVDIPTETLPWAHVIYGDSKRFATPALDEWVVGFFLDGEEAQKPIVIGTLPGIPLDEPTTSRWSRNERTEETPIYQTKQVTLSTNSITEPSTPYAAEYPHNKVIETESGHLIEIDDTEGAERIHIYHKSGTFTEIHPDGKKVDKNTGDAFEIDLANKRVAVTGEYTVESVTGAKLNISDIGLLSYSNPQQDLKVLIDTLIDELIAFQTVGSPGNHQTAPTTLTKLQLLKQQFALLLE